MLATHHGDLEDLPEVLPGFFSSLPLQRPPSALSGPTPLSEPPRQRCVRLGEASIAALNEALDRCTAHVASAIARCPFQAFPPQGFHPESSNTVQKPIEGRLNINVRLCLCAFFRFDKFGLFEEVTHQGFFCLLCVQSAYHKYQLILLIPGIRRAAGAELLARAQKSLPEAPILGPAEGRGEGPIGEAAPEAGPVSSLGGGVHPAGPEMNQADLERGAVLRAQVEIAKKP